MEICNGNTVRAGLAPAPTTNKHFINMKRTILLTTVALFIFSSCIDPAVLQSVLDALLNGAPITSITFSNETGDKKTIDLNSPMAWMVKESPDWLLITPPSGNGAQKVTIEVIQSNTTQNPRNGTIVFLAANGDKLTITVQQQADLYATFKADSRPRWETVGSPPEYNDESPNTFITDTGADSDGRLFSSIKYKIGRITSDDGSSYEIIEFDAPLAKGTPANGQIRKASGGLSALYSLEIVQVQGNTIWMVFKETSSSPERRVVL